MRKLYRCRLALATARTLDSAVLHKKGLRFPLSAYSPTGTGSGYHSHGEMLAFAFISNEG